MSGNGLLFGWFCVSTVRGKRQAMKKCEVCGTTILFGPVRDGGHVYCGYECMENGRFEEHTSFVPDDIAFAQAKKINAGACPKCGGPGPVDVLYSHTVWSALVMTSYKSNPEVSCGACGRKAKATALVFSALFGWWGFPFGLFLTPIQVARNLFGMFGGPKLGHPSADLLPIAKLMLANEVEHRAEIIDATIDAQEMGK